MKLRPILTGLLSNTPLLNLMHRDTGGTNSARYCYSVWLRHLTIAYENGLSTHPRIIAELGPGDSIGIGLAGLISGANKYYSFDVVKYSTINKNLQIFDEIAKLFLNREDIPSEDEFPRVKPNLKSYRFPDHIFTDFHLEYCLKPERLSAIKSAILNLDNQSYEGKILIKLFVPWYDSRIIQKESVDFVYSQAVLEHVEDIDNTYKSLYYWLKPGGYMSNQIDFTCHLIADKWNGHWAYSDLMWKIIKGKRLFLLNRLPFSVHKGLHEKYNFEIFCDIRTQRNDGLERKQLAPRFKNICDEDFITSGVHVFSKK